MFAQSIKMPPNHKKDAMPVSYELHMKSKVEARENKDADKIQAQKTETGCFLF